MRSTAVHGKIGHPPRYQSPSFSFNVRLWWGAALILKGLSSDHPFSTSQLSLATPEAIPQIPTSP